MFLVQTYLNFFQLILTFNSMILHSFISNILLLKYLFILGDDTCNSLINFLLQFIYNIGDTCDLSSFNYASNKSYLLTIIITCQYLPLFRRMNSFYFSNIINRYKPEFVYLYPPPILFSN